MHRRLLFAAIAAVLTACGGANDEPSTGASADAADTSGPKDEATRLAAANDGSVAQGLSADLSATGTADWAAWGQGGVPGVVRKATGGSQIGAYTLVGGGAVSAYANDPRALSWTDGAPQAANAGSRSGVWIGGVGNGFSVALPAGTASRSVTVYVGGWRSSGRFSAQLSDGSAAAYADTTPLATGQYVRAYTVVYAAASAGQQLVLTWTQASGSGNVTLNGVALGAVVGPNRLPTLATPAPQSTVQGQPVTLALAGADPDGDALRYSASGLPAGLAVDAVTGAVGGVPRDVGSSTVVATVQDGRGGSASASWVWSVQPAPPGSLSGSNAQALAADLGTTGTADWASWGHGGVPGLVRKAGGGGLIGTASLVQSSSATAYANDLRALAWSGGTPLASSAGSRNGVYVGGVGTGFRLAVPAGTVSRTVTLYVGGWRSSGRLAAQLSDGSAAAYVDTTPLATGQYVRAYTLVYAAGTEGQQLLLTWTQAAGSGNVTLNGAALSLPAVNRLPTLAAPPAQTSLQGRALTLALAGNDADGDPLTYSATGLPAGLAIAPTTGTVSGTPTTPGTSAVVVTAQDGRGGSASANFAWTVLAPPPPDLASGLDARPGNAGCVAPARPQAGTGLQLARVFPGLSFSQPVGLYQAPGDATRWFVIEQESGLVRSFPNTPAVQANQVTTVLSLAGKIQSESEMGLLGLAFHPQWPSVPQVFVYYSAVGTNPVENRVSRFTSANGGVSFDPASEQVILRLVKNQRDTNHNGGHIVFGPDGHLYIGTGDGGAGGDPMNNAQNPNVLFGKMLRIDVNVPSGYAIPGGASGNPYAGNPQCTNGTGAQPCPEVFATGLRNPWRWSFDKSTGDLWVADVGQGEREEVAVVRRGSNHGWRIREGSLCYSPGSNCGTTSASGEPLVDPLVEYGHDIGFAVTGGFVYRGTKLPGLVGRYVFGDYVSSRVFVFQPPDPLAPATPRRVLTAADTALTAPQNITAFAQANDGELYVLGYGGAVYALQSATAAVDTIPSLLSQTGCVAAGNARQPAAGLVPYRPNAPFWSDGADKQRWLALPDGSALTPQTPGSWNAPNGTVLVKNFLLDNQLIETRLFMRHPDGVWAGYTYEWNAAQTDATRVVGGKRKVVSGPSGAQTWVYPSENDCLLCHTQVAGRVLGLETAQLNGPLGYPQTGRTANQITTLNTVGLTSPAVAGDPAALPAYFDPHGAAGTVEQRARAFLHTNCAQCHQPNGPTPVVGLDLRYTTPFAQTGMCNATPLSGDLGLANAKLVVPGAPDSSVLLSRVNRRDAAAMPPLGSTVVDTKSVAVLREWIAGLAACP